MTCCCHIVSDLFQTPSNRNSCMVLVHTTWMLAIRRRMIFGLRHDSLHGIILLILLLILLHSSKAVEERQVARERVSAKEKLSKRKKQVPDVRGRLKKRKLQQRDSAEEFLWGPGAKQRSSLVDQDMVEGEEKIRRQIQEEMGRYEAIAVPPPGTVPCQWWHVHQCELPSLARVARMCMAIPGSSASVERAFSAFARLADPPTPAAAASQCSRPVVGPRNLKRGWSGGRIRSQRHGDELERDGS